MDHNSDDDRLVVAAEIAARRRTLQVNGRIYARRHAPRFQPLLAGASTLRARYIGQVAWLECERDWRPRIRVASAKSPTRSQRLAAFIQRPRSPASGRRKAARARAAARRSRTARNKACGRAGMACRAWTARVLQATAHACPRGYARRPAGMTPPPAPRAALTPSRMVRRGLFEDDPMNQHQIRYSSGSQFGSQKGSNMGMVRENSIEIIETLQILDQEVPRSSRGAGTMRVGDLARADQAPFA